ncbi:MAG: type I methionyl aminopeptidase [Desulfobacteraceae bacterium IS3]|nr:MAG: type I methionyl aminopeptidase [Desulfobacteraceae bacterium IS3]
MKVGRNDPCPCGSGQKFKKCCLMKKGRLIEPSAPLSPKDLYYKKHKIRLKSNEDIEGIRKTGKLVIDTLNRVEEMIRPGLKTEEINTLVHEYTVRSGAKPAPLHYRGFPKSTCVSVNDVICHGIPGERVLKEGDIVNVDITSVLNGYYADANKTFFVGTPGEKAQKIVRITKECLKIGMSVVKPGNTTGDIGWAIQNYAEKQGCSVVREFVGHGVGFEFHEPPQIMHYGNRKSGIILIPGMVFTIEPMINLGRKDLRVLKDKWTVITKDGSLSAQFEQTVLVTENGCESMTPYNLTD